MANFCKNCGTQLNEGARFCKGCGAHTSQPAPLAPETQQTALQSSQPTTNPPQKQNTASPDPSRGPIAFSWQSLKGAVKNIGVMFKKPSALLPALVTMIVQTVLSFMKIGDPESAVITALSFLTFAQGGMYGGIIGAVGGIIGRGIYAWAISSVVTALFSRGKKQPKNAKPKQKAQGGIPRLILGIGLGLIAYNFLSGDASIENAVIGITGAVACWRASKKTQGYMIGLVSSFTRGHLEPAAVSRITQGIAAGMACGTLSSLAVSGYWCYIIGAAVTVIGFASGGLRKPAVRTAAMMALSLVMGAAVVMPNTTSAADKIVLYRMSGHGTGQIGEHNFANVNNLPTDAVLATLALYPAIVTGWQIDSMTDIPIYGRTQIDDTSLEFSLPAFSWNGDIILGDMDWCNIRVSVQERQFTGQMGYDENGNLTGTYHSDTLTYEYAETRERGYEYLGMRFKENTSKYIEFNNLKIRVDIFVPRQTNTATLNISYTADINPYADMRLQVYYVIDDEIIQDDTVNQSDLLSDDLSAKAITTLGVKFDGIDWENTPPPMLVDPNPTNPSDLTASPTPDGQPTPTPPSPIPTPRRPARPGSPAHTNGNHPGEHASPEETALIAALAGLFGFIGAGGSIGGLPFGSSPPGGNPPGGNPSGDNPPDSLKNPYEFEPWVAPHVKSDKWNFAQNNDKPEQVPNLRINNNNEKSDNWNNNMKTPDAKDYADGKQNVPGSMESKEGPYNSSVTFDEKGNIIVGAGRKTKNNSVSALYDKDGKVIVEAGHNSGHYKASAGYDGDNVTSKVIYNTKHNNASVVRDKDGNIIVEAGHISKNSTVSGKYDGKDIIVDAEHKSKNNRVTAGIDKDGNLISGVERKTTNTNANVNYNGKTTNANVNRKVGKGTTVNVKNVGKNITTEVNSKLGKNTTGKVQNTGKTVTGEVNQKIGKNSNVNVKNDGKNTTIEATHKKGNYEFSYTGSIFDKNPGEAVVRYNSKSSSVYIKQGKNGTEAGITFGKNF